MGTSYLSILLHISGAWAVTQVTHMVEMARIVSSKCMKGSFLQAFEALLVYLITTVATLYIHCALQMLWGCLFFLNHMNY